METETIDRLFLELAQISTAWTPRELGYKKTILHLNKRLSQYRVRHDEEARIAQKNTSAVCGCVICSEIRLDSETSMIEWGD